VIIAYQLLVPAIALAQGEHFLSLVLHAEIGRVAYCSEVDEVSCYCYSPHELPATQVPPGTEITVFLVVPSVVCDLGQTFTGVQTAFEWDPSWELLGSVWNCQQNQLVGATPQSPGGPREGTISTVFDCAALGGHSLAIGKLYFKTGSAGCLRQVESAYPYGVFILGCDNQIHSIELREFFRLGEICVGWSAPNGCWDPFSVEDSTWGKIKAQYAR
jgi:hypothetical protein